MLLIHRFSTLLAAATLILIIAGGLVTSTDSGLSVPDWPLSYGRFFPPMIGGVRFEHTHRVIAGVVMILTFVLTFLIFKKSQNRVWRGLIMAASLSVLIQAILGGLTVLYRLPTPISVAHACLGQLFFAATVVLAWLTTRAWQEGERFQAEHIPAFRRLAITLASMVFLQLILGAWTRHTQGQDVGVFLHMGGAVAVLFFTMGIQVHSKLFFKREPRIARVAGAIFALVMFQIFLGISAYYHVVWSPKADPAPLFEVLLATSHQTVGAVLLVLTVILALNAFRFLSPQQAELETTP